MQGTDAIITNSTVKILRYISKHETPTFSALQTKFEGLDYMELVLLCLTGYLTCQKPGKMPMDFRDGKFVVGPDDTFCASPKTIQFLEERFQRRWQWIVPTTISTIALIVSMAAFILSLLPRVTEVRIVP